MLRHEELMAKNVAVEYSRELDMGRRLLRFAQVMLPEKRIQYRGGDREAVVSSILALMTMAMKVFRGIHHLAGNCLTEPALMLLRPLSDALASVGYIVADPQKRAERAELYLAGEVTEYYKWVKKLIQDSAGDLLPPEVVTNPEALLETLIRRLVEKEVSERGTEGAEERAKARLQQMLDPRHGWSGVSLETMFQEARAKQAYPLVFKMASGIMHARRPGMYVTLSDEDVILVKFEADDTNLSLVLFVGNLLFAGILSAVNAIFELGRDRAIEGLIQEIGQMAKERKAKDQKQAASPNAGLPHGDC